MKNNMRNIWFLASCMPALISAMQHHTPAVPGYLDLLIHGQDAYVASSNHANTTSHVCDRNGQPSMSYEQISHELAYVGAQLSSGTICESQVDMTPIHAALFDGSEFQKSDGRIYSIMDTVIQHLEYPAFYNLYCGFVDKVRSGLMPIESLLTGFFMQASEVGAMPDQEGALTPLQRQSFEYARRMQVRYAQLNYAYNMLEKTAEHIENGTYEQRENANLVSVYNMIAQNVAWESSDTPLYPVVEMIVQHLDKVPFHELYRGIVDQVPHHAIPIPVIIHSFFYVASLSGKTPFDPSALTSVQKREFENIQFINGMLEHNIGN